MREEYNTIGQILKNCRIKRKLSLEQVSNKTKISIQSLTNIENGRLDLIANKFFQKSFIKSYSKALRISDKKILLLLDGTNKAIEETNSNTNKINIYFQRAWATVSTKNQNISSHDHPQSHISFAYYLKKSKLDGGIAFIDNHKHNEFITGLFGSKTGGRNVIKKMNALNASAVNIEAEEDDIVIFPSKTFATVVSRVTVISSSRS